MSRTRTVLCAVVVYGVGFLPTSAAEMATPADVDQLVGQPIPGHANLVWQKAELTIEWGFQQETAAQACDGNIESTHLLGVVGTAQPLSDDQVTTMTGARAWRSPAAAGRRRGLVVPVLYTPVVRGPARTIITVRTSCGSFSFQPLDLTAGPILAPDFGFFIRATPQPLAAPAPIAASHTVRVPQRPELLETKLNSRDGDVLLNGWGSADTPCIYAHAGANRVTLLKGAIQLPPRSVVVHPGPDRDATIGWCSPLAVTVSVRAKVVHAHPSGGNGVEWSLLQDAKGGRTCLLRGTLDRGGSLAIPPAAEADRLAAVACAPGDVLSLAVGNRGDHTCDTTCVELTIAEVGGQGRRWDLTQDVVDTIQAGNPHADALGNRHVWYFSAPWQASGPAAGWQPPPMKFQSQATTAREYLAELAKHPLQTIRQQVRQHPEQTWEGAMRALHGDRPFPPFPQPPYAPRMSVEVPDPNLTALWRIGAWQIIKNCPRIRRSDVAKVGQSGDVTAACTRIDDATDPQGVYVVRDNPFPPLGCETDRILWALDHLGRHDVARDGMAVWLENQQADGSLSLNSGMETAHKVGALQLLWVMAEHYRLSGDQEWLRQQLPRLKAAADWILNRRRTTMKDTLSPEELAGIKAGTWSPYGLQPRIQMGDGDPQGAHYFYMADAFAYRSIKLLGDVVGPVDRQLGAELLAEAERYRQDLLPVVEESLVLSPLLRTRAGTYRCFLPQGFQDRGPRALALPETVNIFSHCGPYSSDIVGTSAAIEAWLRSGLLSITDPRLDGHFEVLEDTFLLGNPWLRKRKSDYDPERDWFSHAGWGYQSGWERLPEFYLAQDDVPNFLRAWLNRCAVDMNLSNWTFNEHTTFAQNDKSHGNAVFLSNFRNLLALEIGDVLWLARATPRAWFEQGQKIAVTNAPTHFGTLAYEIVSDVSHGKITATIELPSRRAPQTVYLRFRHPESAPIKSVTVNGEPWHKFDRHQEAIALEGLRGTPIVVANY